MSLKISVVLSPVIDYRLFICKEVLTDLYDYQISVIYSWIFYQKCLCHKANYNPHDLDEKLSFVISL